MKKTIYQLWIFNKVICLFNKLNKNFQSFPEHNTNFLFLSLSAMNGNCETRDEMAGIARLSSLAVSISLLPLPAFTLYTSPFAAPFLLSCSGPTLPLPPPRHGKIPDSCRRRNVFDDFPRLV